MSWSPLDQGALMHHEAILPVGNQQDFGRWPVYRGTTSLTLGDSVLHPFYFGYRFRITDIHRQTQPKFNRNVFYMLLDHFAAPCCGGLLFAGWRKTLVCHVSHGLLSFKCDFKEVNWALQTVSFNLLTVVINVGWPVQELQVSSGYVIQLLLSRLQTGCSAV